MKRSTELKQKLDKALKNVEKRKMTIARQEVQLKKKIAAAEKLGCNVETETARNYAGSGKHDEYWAMCEVSDKKQEIKESKKKLEDLERIARNWNIKYKDALRQEQKIEFEMPVIFQQCKEDLAKSWTESDINRREIMRQKRSELDWDEFRKLYSYNQEQEYNKSDEEFRRANLRDAEAFIIDLYNRVKAITGEVTDWKNIYYGGKALNGLVYGKRGIAKVETIQAGGYNIQRLHLRVLVHEVK